MLRLLGKQQHTYARNEKGTPCEKKKDIACIKLSIVEGVSGLMEWIHETRHTIHDSLDIEGEAHSPSWGSNIHRHPDVQGEEYNN